MSSHPNVYVSASFFVGDALDNLREKIDNCEIDLGWQVASEGDDTNVDGDFSEGTITVFDYITYGWCQSVSPEEFKDRWDKFATDVETYCLGNNYGNPTFRLGANFY